MALGSARQLGGIGAALIASRWPLGGVAASARGESALHHHNVALNILSAAVIISWRPRLAGAQRSPRRGGIAAARHRRISRSRLASAASSASMAAHLVGRLGIGGSSSRHHHLGVSIASSLGARRIASAASRIAASMASAARRRRRRVARRRRHLKCRVARGARNHHQWLGARIGARHASAHRRRSLAHRVASAARRRSLGIARPRSASAWLALFGDIFGEIIAARHRGAKALKRRPHAIGGGGSLGARRPHLGIGGGGVITAAALSAASARISISGISARRRIASAARRLAAQHRGSAAQHRGASASSRHPPAASCLVISIAALSGCGSVSAK